MTAVHAAARKKSAARPAPPRKKKTKSRDQQRDKVMRAIFAETGFAVEVAKHLGVTHQNVSAWRKVPAHHVLELTKLLKLKPGDIRPDVFAKKRKRRS